MDEEEHVAVLSESDEIALEGMGESYEAALRHNDSLALCTIEPLSCDSTTMIHYDEKFHHFDDMFNSHHGNFSHNNVDDDHHHPNGMTVWHGDMMGHDVIHDDEHGDEHDEYTHNNESFEKMMHLRELHDEIHPH